MCVTLTVIVTASMCKHQYVIAAVRCDLLVSERDSSHLGNVKTLNVLMS